MSRLDFMMLLSAVTELPAEQDHLSDSADRHGNHPFEDRGSLPGAIVSCARMVPFLERTCSSPPPSLPRMVRALPIPAACVGVTALAREAPGFRTSQSPSSRCWTTRLLGFPMMLFPFFYMNSCGSAEFGSFDRFGTRVNFGCGSSMPARRRT